MSTILIVDDDAADRELLRRALERTRATFIEAENGAQALDIARREHPDLIILDILMPVMGGEEALGFIRADETLRATRVLVATAVAERDRVMRIIEQKPDAYILKPFDPVDLRDKVTRLLASQRVTAGEAAAADPGVCAAVAHGDAGIRSAILEALCPLSLTLHEAESGPGLIDLAHREHLKLALIDLDLPIIDGSQTARRILEPRADQRVSLVGVANWANAKLSSKLEEDGFGAVLACPFEGWDVLEAVSRALGGRGYWRGSHEGIGVFHLLSVTSCQERAVEMIAGMAEEIESAGRADQGWIVNLLAIQAVPEAVDAIGQALQNSNITSTVHLHLIAGDEMRRRLLNRGIDEMHVHTSLGAAVRSVAV